VAITPTPLAAPAGVAAVVSATLAGYAWRRRSTPGATSFAALVAGVATWASLNALNHVLVHPPTDGLRVAAEWGVSSLVPVFWLAFALAYTGRDDLVSAEFVAALSVLPVASAAGLLVGPAGGGVWRTVALTYGYALALVGVALVVRTAVTSEGVYADQATALVVGAALPAAASVVWALGYVPGDVDPTPAALALSGLAFGHAVFRHRFLELTPATRQIGERAVLRDLTEGVVVVDDDDRVLTVNDAAAATLGRAPAAVVGASVREVLDVPTAEGTHVTEVETDDGRRTLEATVSPVSEAGERIGHTLVVRDVTERRQRRQQLAALNRVLRHNLRNDMNVVNGYAQTLATSDAVPEREAEMARCIERQSASLLSAGSKVREMEAVMDDDDRRRPFDLVRTLESVAADAREADSATTVRVVAGQTPAVASNDRIVETVVGNAVENAVVHGGDRVTVDAEVEDGWATVTVTDDGPGVPEAELAAIRAGRETDLQHSSGLGLWVMQWGVTRLGGDLTVERPADGGTRVRLRFPVGRPDEGVPSPADDDADAGSEADATPDHGVASGGPGTDRAGRVAAPDGGRPGGD
jgi:PAS domain S-box-containing protein